MITRGRLLLPRESMVLPRWNGHAIFIPAGILLSDPRNQSHSTGGWWWRWRHMGKRLVVVPEQVEEETMALPTLEE